MEHSYSLSAIELVRWWCHLGNADIEALLTPDFEFDSGLETIGRATFLTSWQHSGSQEELDILEVWSSDGRVSLMFEATDNITGMRHRLCWLISFDAHLIQRVRACAGRIPDPRGAPAT